MHMSLKFYRFFKFMQKFSLILLLTPSLAFATTEGHYLGTSLNLVNANYEYGDKRNGSGSNSIIASPNDLESESGFGVDYKYAFNFNKFFISPGVFYNTYGGKHESDGTIKFEFFGKSKPVIAINETYGAKFDLGYDISKRTALYLSQGLMMVNYQSYTFTRIPSTFSEYSYHGTSHSKLGYFFGGGLSVRAWESVIFNFEYNKQMVNFSVPQSDRFHKDTMKSSSGIIRIGIGYQF